VPAGFACGGSIEEEEEEEVLKAKQFFSKSDIFAFFATKTNFSPGPSDSVRRGTWGGPQKKERSYKK
jgi:hypothetical protein